MILVRTESSANLSTTGSGNKVHWMVSKEDGSTHFEMRQVTIPPAGKSSKGRHEHEHVVYVLQGEGEIVGANENQVLLPGCSVFVPSNEEHQWINHSESNPFVFLCVIPSGAEDFLK